MFYLDVKKQRNFVLFFFLVFFVSSFSDLVAVEFHDPESVIFFARFAKKREFRGRH
jgi:hypothetical protein